MRKNIKLTVSAACVLGLALVLALYLNHHNHMLQDTQGPSETEAGQEPVLYAGITQAIQEKVFDAGIVVPGLKVVVSTPQQQADRVYSFLQGPKSYEEGRPWAGSWCELLVGWNTFGGFGCGHCCMANIYSSLSPYECSPLDIYHYATQVSRYYPSEESGAIDWGDMQTTLQASGLSCDLHQKPENYEEFQDQMKHAKSAIVLVSSANDDTFWKDTGGHYVNIWLYQPDEDMVFLAEPGDPESNRTWIPLRYVYDALKTVSPYQYLSVSGYSEEENQWKWDGISDEWNGKG